MVFIFAQPSLLKKLPLSDPQLLYERPGRGWMGPMFPLHDCLVVHLCLRTFIYDTPHNSAIANAK